MSGRTEQATEAPAIGRFNATTGALASMLGAKLDGPADIELTGFATLDAAGPGQLSFIRSERYAKAWAGSDASAALVSTGISVPGHDASSRALLFVDDADLALIRLLEHAAPSEPPVEPGVHPSASVDPTARVAGSASIGPGCVVEAGAVVGEGVVLMANVYIGRGSAVGAGTRVMPGVYIGAACRIGKRCLLHANCSIGADGFGFRPAADGRGLVKVPHLAGVVVEDEVEIGANTCIDRGKLDDTFIGAGTKIDNLVQIAHNARIGRCCIICGQVGIAGSVVLGDGVILAARAAVSDNITIGPGATLAASSGTMKDIPAGETWAGVPAGPARQMTENYAALRNLASFMRDFRKLRKELQQANEGGRGDAESRA